MVQIIKIGGFLAGVTIVFVLSGCFKDRSLVTATGAEITRPVTFSQDIAPLFTKSCGVSGCHVPGGKSPDLSQANAFNSLTVGNFFNTSSPESSLIYLWMTGKKSTPMPVGGLDKEYNALVLAWIKQGAQNN